MEHRLTDDWKDVDDLVIYGFGKVAHDNLQFFKGISILYVLLMEIRINAESSLKEYQ